MIKTSLSRLLIPSWQNLKPMLTLAILKILFNLDLWLDNPHHSWLSKWCDATILCLASHQHPSWHVHHIHQNKCRKIFVDTQATPIMNGDWKQISIAKLVAIENFRLPLSMVTKTFQSPQKGCVSYVFGKSLMTTFQKHITCLHFWSPSNNGGVLIGDQ